MKALTLVLCILALLGSAASGYFWWQIGDTKKQLQSKLETERAGAEALREDLAKANASRTAVQADLTRSDADLGDAKSRLTAAEARTIQVAREAETLKRSISEKEAAEKKLTSDLDELRRELVQTRLAAQSGSPEEIEKYKQTIATLEARVIQAQSAVTASASASGSGENASSANPAQPELSARTAAARVAKVGRKNSFVILELGTADGVAVGHKFTITRKGETIAESVISEVNSGYAIAQVAPSSIKTTLTAGDIATYTK
ncbi:MAG: hypothetical protein NTU80_10135 [Verrucomicrobia bacterium]|nr:hypothetical protein [Verrucomicrobiota bacterium]